MTNPDNLEALLARATPGWAGAMVAGFALRESRCQHVEDAMEAKKDSFLAREIATALPDLLKTLRANAETIARMENDLRVAASEVSSWATKAGHAQGRLEASEMVGVVDGWRDRALVAEEAVTALRTLREQAGEGDQAIARLEEQRFAYWADTAPALANKLEHLAPEVVVPVTVETARKMAMAHGRTGTEWMKAQAEITTLRARLSEAEEAAGVIMRLERCR